MTGEDDKLISRIYASPGYGPAYVKMVKANYRHWARLGDPMYVKIVKQMECGETEDDPNAHHGHSRR